ncbi:MAG TPA: PEP/pyruvate-binding domain-containing protein [Candidatus Limnocylindria bacterium]|nr:PEP/pyruvate-binding domain-containing protein [Candidatus Limnocylindria bacterium]
MRAIDLGDRAAQDPGAVGHKAANLARLASAFRVPPAFCLSTAVYDELKGALGPDGDAARAALRNVVAEAYARLGAAVGEPDVRVAVRSSATGEDGTDASFAGQHETILDVQGADAVVEAVLECWRSAGNERVTAYRRQKGIDAPVHVAVLVQQMVRSDVSAIAFGVDPVSGDGSVIVIDAARGLGDKIASGEVTPDRYVVLREDLAVRGPADGTLSADEARGIAKLVLALEQENGHAVDVECAYAANQLYLLQCRPITTLASAFPVEWSHPDDAKLHWRREDAHQSGPSRRLALAVWRNSPAYGVRKRAEIDDLPMAPRFAPFHGRLYLAVERRRRDGDMSELQRRATARVRARARTWRRVWDEDYVPRLRAHYAWIDTVIAELPTAPLATIATRWDELWPRLHDIWTMHMLTTGAAYPIMDELAETYERLTGGTTAEALKLTQARTPALQRLARDFHALLRLYTGSDRAAFERAADAFVAAHGNLGSSGEDVAEPTWQDDRGLLMAELDRRAAHPEEDPDARTARLIAEGDAIAARTRELLRDRPADLAAFEEILAAARAVGPLTEEHNYVLDRQIQARTGRLIRAVGARMAREDLLGDAADIWHFEPEEISAALRGEQQIRGLTAARAAEFASWQRLRHPKVLGSPIPPPAPIGSAQRVDLWHRTAQDETGVIKGQPASSGRVRGRARLVRSGADFGKMTRGDVLVCRSSNVSWIPLFTIAAAVVTDVGGSLSHAAVVAREFGVPAVVGCAVALETLRDGQLVEVDGDRGIVRPLD